MTMEPQSLEEYLSLFEARQRVEGTGVNTSHVFPCPFCAAESFITYRVVDVREALKRETICQHCHRGCKTLFSGTSREGFSFEIVQTVGPEPPAWLLPKMRRLSAEELEHAG